MKLKMTARDKSSNWHGARVFTLSLYLEVQDVNTRDRIWTAIEKALPEPEEAAKGKTMGIRKEGE